MKWDIFDLIFGAAIIIVGSTLFLGVAGIVATFLMLVL